MVRDLSIARQLDPQFQQLLNELGSLEFAERAGAWRAGMAKAGDRVRRAAAALTPPPGYEGDDPGKPALADSYVVKVVKYPTGWFMAIGARWPDGAHSHLLEDGVQPHAIYPAQADALVEPHTDPPRAYGAAVDHPGHGPSDIMEKAWQLSSPALLAELERLIVREFERVLGMAAKKSERARPGR